MKTKKGRPHHRAKYTSPYVLYSLVSLGIFIASALFWLIILDTISLFWLYVLSINMATLFIYGFDKVVPNLSLRMTRVPERVLHGLALLGGTPMGFIAQIFFRHKTRKMSFIRTYKGIILLQLCLLGLYMYMTY